MAHWGLTTRTNAPGAAEAGPRGRLRTTPRAPARRPDHGPDRGAPAPRSAGVRGPTAASRRTGTRCVAAPDRSRSGAAPAPARRRTLQRRSRAPFRHPSTDFTAAHRPQHGLGKRIDRHVFFKESRQDAPEQERAPAFEGHLIDLDADLEA